MYARYRFRRAVDEIELYPDGTEVPHRFSIIERQRPNGKWVAVGYAEIQLRKVLRDDAGVVDLAFSGLVSSDTEA